MHYDPKINKYLGYGAGTDMSSINVDEGSGTIRFATASLNEVEAGDMIGDFKFERRCDDMPVTIEVKEKGSEISLTETETKTAKGIGHKYFLGFWDWDEDYSGAKVFFYCEHDENHREKVYATVTKSVREATADRAGAITYTASAWFNGQEYTDTKTIVLPATGHTYEFVGFEWSEDGSTAYAIFKDVKTGETIKVEASISEVRVEPTVNEDGSVTYTATVEYGGKTYTEEKTIKLDKIEDKSEEVTPEKEEEKDDSKKGEADGKDDASESDKKDAETKKSLAILDAVFALGALGLGVFMALKGKFLGLAVSALSLIGFFLTQSLSGSLIFADKWAILQALLCAANGLLLLFGRKKEDDLF